MSVLEQSRGRLIVLVGPSGSGKTTLARVMIASAPGRRCFSVSHTTRPMRVGENDGEDYRFVSRAVFEQMIANGEFIEHAEVHGNLYGTSRAAVDAPLRGGRDVLFDVDIQGAAALHRAFGDEAHLVFVVPPSWNDLVQRLVRRSSETPASLNRRLTTARAELSRVVKDLHQGVPWGCLVNDQLEAAQQRLEAMVSAPPKPASPGERQRLEEMFAAAMRHDLSTPS